jgi:hypothetical protein
MKHSEEGNHGPGRQLDSEEKVDTKENGNFEASMKREEAEGGSAGGGDDERSPADDKDKDIAEGFIGPLPPPVASTLTKVEEEKMEVEDDEDQPANEEAEEEENLDEWDSDGDMPAYERRRWQRITGIEGGV